VDVYKGADGVIFMVDPTKRCVHKTDSPIATH
jgi:hypothetical protein